MEKLRWGVLGVAKIAVEKVIPAIQKSSKGRVTAIASRDRERAREAANRLDISEAHSSYAALLASEQVDAVYVALPNHLHKEWTIASAQAGKHVLCEKPLALTSRDAMEMVDACRDAGVVLMEAFMYRLHPAWEEVRRLVAAGAIGELRVVHTGFSYFNDDPENIRNKLEYGGGALMDIGCYAINLSRMLFAAEPNRIEAAIRRDPTFGTDVVSSALLEFGSGQATFTVATQLEPDQRVMLGGTRGRLIVEIPFNIPPDRETHLQLISGGNPSLEPAIRKIVISPADPYTVQSDAFAEAVRSRGPAPIPVEDAVANMKVMERVFESAGWPSPFASG